MSGNTDGQMGLPLLISEIKAPPEHRSIVVESRKCQTGGVPRQSRGISHWLSKLSLDLGPWIWEVVEALIIATQTGSISSREDFLDGLLVKGAPLI
jgi:hypothetical protein